MGNSGQVKGSRHTNRISKGDGCDAITPGGRGGPVLENKYKLLKETKKNENIKHKVQINYISFKVIGKQDTLKDAQMEVS